MKLIMDIKDLNWSLFNIDNSDESSKIFELKFLFSLNISTILLKKSLNPFLYMFIATPGDASDKSYKILISVEEILLSLSFKIIENDSKEGFEI